MSRIPVVLLLAISVLGGGTTAGAAENKRTSTTRTVEIQYEGGAVPFVTCVDCPQLTARPGERFVSIEVIDDVAPVGYVDIAWFDPSHGYFPVCGKTEEPQRIPPGVSELTAYPWHVPGLECSRGFATSGTIRLTFSRRLP